MKKQVRSLVPMVAYCVITVSLGVSFLVMNVFFSSYEKRMVEDGTVLYVQSSDFVRLSHGEVKAESSIVYVACTHESQERWTTDADTKLETGDKVRVSLVETYKRKYPWPFSFTWIYDKVRAEEVVFVERPPKDTAVVSVDFIPMTGTWTQTCMTTNGFSISTSTGSDVYTTEPK